MPARSFRIGVVVVLVVLSLTILAALLLYRSGVVSFPDGNSVLINGSFEDGVLTPAPTETGLMSLPPGDTTMPGWKVLGDTRINQDVAWMDQSNRFVRDAATDGKHFLDLTGKNDRPLPDGSFAAVTQTFPTKAGKPYRLSFDIMVFNSDFPGPISVLALISNGTPDQAYARTTCGPFDPDHKARPGNQSMACALSFTARATNTNLALIGTQGSHYIGLDNVSVQCVAPLGRPGFCS